MSDDALMSMTDLLHGRLEDGLDGHGHLGDLLDEGPQLRRTAVPDERRSQLVHVRVHAVLELLGGAQGEARRSLGAAPS